MWTQLKRETEVGRRKEGGWGRFCSQQWSRQSGDFCRCSSPQLSALICRGFIIIKLLTFYRIEANKTFFMSRTQWCEHKRASRAFGSSFEEGKEMFHSWDDKKRKLAMRAEKLLFIKCIIGRAWCDPLGSALCVAIETFCCSLFSFLFSGLFSVMDSPHHLDSRRKSQR